MNMRNIHSHDYGTMFVVYFLQLVDESPGLFQKYPEILAFPRAKPCQYLQIIWSGQVDRVIFEQYTGNRESGV